ncbi:MAG: peptide ABC transporter ATP-binding protein [Acidobacteria bacterium]|nr:MAG: peptide ABC transporter ATP-binding protein [Acidobacteriota bacterium]
MPSLLTVSHLSKRFRVPGGTKLGVTAVRNVSFDIFKGEILGIAGESGSGKTTVSRLILGLEQADEGEIRYQGKALSSDDPVGQKNFRREVQAIFQDPFASLNPVMRVGRIISEPLKIQGVTAPAGNDKRVRELLEMVGLPASCASKRPGQLSGGEQQRVCIARALALQPGLLVADEPVSALDAELRGGVLALLKEFRDKEGISILLIAHDLALFRGIADRVAIMYEGEIVEIGRTDEVLNRPRHPYTMELLQAVPPYRIEDLLNNTRGRQRNERLSEGKFCRYLPRCLKAQDCCREKLPPEIKSESGFYRCHF